MTYKEILEVEERNYVGFVSARNCNDPVYNRIREWHWMIIKAIKKQVPEKVVFVPEPHGLQAYCPACNEEYYFKRTGDKYCYNCGQALDWSE